MVSYRTQQQEYSQTSGMEKNLVLGCQELWILSCWLLLLFEWLFYSFLLEYGFFPPAILSIWLKVEISELYSCYISYIRKINLK